MVAGEGPPDSRLEVPVVAQVGPGHGPGRLTHIGLPPEGCALRLLRELLVAIQVAYNISDECHSPHFRPRYLIRVKIAFSCRAPKQSSVHECVIEEGRTRLARSARGGANML